MVYGSPDTALLKPWSQSFKNVVVRGELPADAPPNCWGIEDFSDRMHFDLGIYGGAAALSTERRRHAIDRSADPGGWVILTAGYFPRLEQDLPNRSVVRLDPNDAYRGQMARWAGIASLLKSAEGRTVAIQ